MNKVEWKTIARKTKWASGKKRLGKAELGDLLANVTALERFMAGNKSDFASANRKEQGGFATRQHLDNLTSPPR